MFSGGSSFLGYFSILYLAWFSFNNWVLRTSRDFFLRLAKFVFSTGFQGFSRAMGIMGDSRGFRGCYRVKWIVTRALSTMLD